MLTTTAKKFKMHRNASFSALFRLLTVVLLIGLISSCKTEQIDKKYDNNNALNPGNLPTVKIENYVKKRSNMTNL